jgi:hypothetical protein
MPRIGTRLLVILGALTTCAALAVAQETPLNWARAVNGAVPAGAVPYGRDADGRPEYVCRAVLGGGMQLGRIEQGISGCSVGYRQREIVVASYEVLVEPALTLAGRSRPTVVDHRTATEATVVDHRTATEATIVDHRAVIEASALGHKKVTLPGVVPPTPADGSKKRGFDEHGQPYVDVRLPDGTIKRTQMNGVTLFKPDGTSQFIPNMSIRENVQPPTPPSLPDDPRQGRVWIERHNDDLLEVIANMVKHDEDEMKKFSDAERDAAGDDLFQQIAYRTKIADFLAIDR